MAELSQAIDIDEIALGLPRRIHQIATHHVAQTPDQIALIEDGACWTCGDLDRHVSELLSSHKDVVQCAVVGRVIDGNEDVVGFVQLRPGSRAKPADLIGFIRFQLTPYKRPSEIIVLESLPATSSGKILKHVLAESLGGAAASGAGRPISQAAI